MEAHVQRALDNDRVIDITTKGRSSGLDRRIEIWFHNIDGRIFITGMPGRRSWYANLLADPALTFHVKETTTADLAATALPIVEPGDRRRVFEILLSRLGYMDNFEDWMAGSPLVEIEFAAL